MSDPRVKVISYSVEVLPLDHIGRTFSDWSIFNLRIDRTGPDTWAVRWGGSWCFNRQGRMDEEPTPSSRTEHWLKSHRFTEAGAIALALKLIPKRLAEATRTAA